MECRTMSGNHGIRLRGAIDRRSAETRGLKRTKTFGYPQANYTILAILPMKVFSVTCSLRALRLEGPSLRLGIFMRYLDKTRYWDRSK